MEDKLGKPLAVGDYVACLLPHYRELTIGRVLRFGKKQVSLRVLDSRGDVYEGNYSVYPKDVIKLDDVDVAVTLLSDKI